MISIVVPVYNEAENIQPFLRDLEAQLAEPHETLIVYDFPEDTTLPAVAAMAPPLPQLAARSQYARQRGAERAQGRLCRQWRRRGRGYDGGPLR